MALFGPNAFIGGIAADKTGHVWLVLSPPDSNIGTETVLRCYTVASHTFVDYVLQDIVSPAHDGYTNAYGGLFIDNNGACLVPMATFDGGGNVVESWIVWVTTSGATGWVAGGWPGSQVPETATNVADGVFGQSLVRNLTMGNAIASSVPTGQVNFPFYFLDTDGTNILYRVMQALARPTTVGWAIGAVTFAGSSSLE